MRRTGIWTVAIVGLLLGAADISAAADNPLAGAADERAATTVTQDVLLERIGRGDPSLVVLDVRSPAEFAEGHVPGARNVSHDQIDARLAELADAKEKDVVVYCRSGRRSQVALMTLSAKGFTRLAHLEGDYLAWTAASRPTERSPDAAVPVPSPAVTPVNPPVQVVEPVRESDQDTRRRVPPPSTGPAPPTR